MTDITYTVEDLLEDSIKDILIQSNIDANIFTTFDDITKNEKYVSITCVTGDIELAEGEVTGNWTSCTLQVSVITDYKRVSKQDHIALTAKVREVLWSDTLADDINNLSKGIYLHLIAPTGSSREADGDIRVTNTDVIAEEIYITDIIEEASSEE